MRRHIQILATMLLTAGAMLSPASAHVMAWREGDSRLKGFGHCSKGPCMKRYDFRPSKPHHHHHGQRVVVGTNRHDFDCRYQVK